MKDIPSTYICSTCGATGVKLWRKRDSVPVLFCAHCASKIEYEDVSSMDAEGCHKGRFGLTATIGAFVPAFPKPEGGFWPCKCVPDDAVKWWQNLPNTNADSGNQSVLAST